MKKIVVVPNPHLKDKEAVLEKVLKELKAFEVKVFDDDLYNKRSYNKLNKLLKDIDLMITLGGDGSILKVCELAARNNVLIMGINYGGVGYLSSLKKNELHKLSGLSKNKYQIIERSMLEVEVDGKAALALNDVIISKKEINIPVKIRTLVNDEQYEIFGDGVIVSTKTGSSAYNYSAGGPLLDSDDEFVLTPICPTQRKNCSLVLKNRETVLLESIRDNRDEALLSVDGSKPVLINKDILIKVKLSDIKVKTIIF